MDSLEFDVLVSTCGYSRNGYCTIESCVCCENNCPLYKDEKDNQKRLRTTLKMDLDVTVQNGENEIPGANIKCRYRTKDEKGITKETIIKEFMALNDSHQMGLSLKRALCVLIRAVSTTMMQRTFFKNKNNEKRIEKFIRKYF